MPSHKKFNDKMCVYCATQPATTEDHVFARGFFVEARRDNLPKVPACQPCNQVKSGLEHYLATVLPFAGRHADAPANLQDMVPRTAMSQANACELKAALGHVLVSPSPSNWQHDNADDHDRWRNAVL